MVIAAPRANVLEKALSKSLSLRALKIELMCFSAQEVRLVALAVWDIVVKLSCSELVLVGDLILGEFTAVLVSIMAAFISSEESLQGVTFSAEQCMVQCSWSITLQSLSPSVACQQFGICIVIGSSYPLVLA